MNFGASRITHGFAADPAAIAGYMGKSEMMDDAIASFAMTYAAQTTIDHAALVRAKTNQDGKKLKLVVARNQSRIPTEPPHLRKSKSRFDAPQFDNNMRCQRLKS
jgi:hypothetical protein